MRITTKSRTAITALIDLALHSEQGRTVSLAEIAERRQISLSYLEQLFATLRAANIVNSFRGPGGGYTLAKEVVEISLKDIVLAIDGGNSKKSPTNDLWSSLETFMFEHMAGISLASLVQDNLDKLEPVIAKPKKEKVANKRVASLQKKISVAKKVTVEKKRFIANSVFSWAKHLKQS